MTDMVTQTEQVANAKPHSYSRVILKGCNRGSVHGPIMDSELSSPRFPSAMLNKLFYVGIMQKLREKPILVEGKFGYSLWVLHLSIKEQKRTHYAE